MSGGPALRGVGARGALGARAVDGILLPATSDSRHSRRSLGISPAGAGGSAANCFACSAAASYTCPRCSVPYCSAACYRHARHACSEDFYRAEVEAELRRTQADAGSAQRMLAMLQRVEHEQQQLVDAAGRPRAIEDDDGEDDEDVAQAAAPGFGPDLADRWVFVVESHQGYALTSPSPSLSCQSKTNPKRNKTDWLDWIWRMAETLMRPRCGRG